MKILETKNLQVAIGNKTICQNLNLDIKPGEVWGILGANGSGKTTLLHTLAGIYPPAEGDILLHSKKLSQLSIKTIAQQLAILFQHISTVFSQTVFEYCLAARFPHRHYFQRETEVDKQIVLSALEKLTLTKLADKQLAYLSGGEKRRAAIAAVLAQTPDIYLLDEPTNHLDVHHQQTVLQLFCKLAQEKNTGILMVLHDVNLAQQFCDHMLMIFEDGLMQGTTQEMLTKENLFRLYKHSMQKISSGYHQTLWWPG